MTKTNFEGLKEVAELWKQSYTRGFVKAERVEEVEAILELDKRNKMDLQNLRDFTVMFFDVKVDCARAESKHDEFNRYRDCMSAVTHIIDSHLHKPIARR